MTHEGQLIVVCEHPLADLTAELFHSAMLQVVMGGKMCGKRLFEGR